MTGGSAVTRQDPSKQDLIDELVRVNDEDIDEDRVPNYQDVASHACYSVYRYVSVWGSVAQARVEADLNPPRRDVVLEYLEEKMQDTNRSYVRSSEIAASSPLPSRSISGVLADLEEEGENGLDVTRRGETTGSTIWEVTRSG